jgi:LuxR family maltose regulon positive regulatory protein
VVSVRLKEDGVHPDFIDTIFKTIETSIKSAEDASETIKSSPGQAQKGSPSTFTRREFEVLEFIAVGLRNKEIAEKLFNSEETIKKHIYNMFMKMNVKNRLSLVSKAKEEGILP